MSVRLNDSRRRFTSVRWRSFSTLARRHRCRCLRVGRRSNPCVGTGLAYRAKLTVYVFAPDLLQPFPLTFGSSSIWIAQEKDRDRIGIRTRHAHSYPKGDPTARECPLGDSGARWRTAGPGPKLIIFRRYQNRCGWRAARDVPTVAGKGSRHRQGQLTLPGTCLPAGIRTGRTRTYYVDRGLQRDLALTVADRLMAIQRLAVG